MRGSLSQSELGILDHQVGWLKNQLGEIVSLLESRLVPPNELVASAKGLQVACERFANVVRVQRLRALPNIGIESASQKADLRSLK
jgi:hypothetical protein